jgi:flagellar biosynthetic protein FlhB
MDSGSKTERATPRKKDDERKKGNIFQSKDLTTALSFLGMVCLLKMGGGWMLGALERLLKEGYLSISSTSQLTLRGASEMMSGFGINLALILVPITGAAMLLGILITGVQTRFLITPSLLGPKLSRINPLTGLKNLFSPKTMMELLKSIVKVIIIGGILYADLTAKLPTIELSALVGPTSSMQWVANSAFDIIVRITAFMAAFAAFDYMYQWWDYEKRLRMTKEEVKEEHKRLEGDPNIKGRIRSLQRRMAQARMMHKVPAATVVIKNPTHYAVALKYEPPQDISPVVVAKGINLVALRIIKIAEENGVYVTENRPLARGLYESVELNQEIPEQFFKPVADIIAFLYRLKKRRPA